MNQIPLYKQILLNEHGVIEASAGTGKTYTLENLVIRLLLEKEIEPDKIVVVTFTEKATGELKLRIRNNLEKCLGTEVDTKSKIQKILEKFDTLCINTIHGFCNKILQDYAFEIGEDFSKEIVDDTLICKKLLYQIMRRRWSEIFGTHFEILSQLSGFFTDKKRFIDDILQIINLYRPYSNDLLLPEFKADINTIAGMIETVHKNMDSLSQVIGPVKNRLEENQFYCQYASYSDCIGYYNQNLKTILKIIELVKKIQTSNFPYLHLNQFFTTHTDIVRKIERAATLKKNSRVKDLYAEIPGLGILKATIQSLSETRIYYYLKIYTIKLLFNELENYKQENGLISYNDMLYLVYRGINQPESRLLVLLQKKYQYALVDEFQDTDQIQWEIFKKIFVEVPYGKNKIFVIGDPKQAIYGFRNADINTYLSAKKFLISDCKAELYQLKTNWRSNQLLINQFNRLFGCESWRFDQEEKINYLPLDYPPDKRSQENEVDLKKGINMIDFGSTSVKNLKNVMSDFIATEIKQLILHEPCITLQDIAIIVRKGTEARFIEKKLHSLNIKCSIYKEQGLYQSIEAKNLKFLLAALAHPENREMQKKALFTQFFNYSPIEIYLVNQNNQQEFFHIENWKKWQIYADKKRWSALFHSIFFESGLFFRLIQNDDQFDYDAEKVICNYRQLAEELEQFAIIKNSDIQSLVQYLSNRINGLGGDIGSENFHRKESDIPKVQILTMHACKGLEFPVVFIFGGFSLRNQNSFFKYHDQMNHVVYDFLKSPEHKKIYLNEIREEEKRLFYVAFTRAISTLYIPYFQPESKQSKGSLGGFVAESLKQAFSRQKNMIQSFKGTEASHNNIDQKIQMETGNLLKHSNLLKENDMDFNQLFIDLPIEEISRRKLTVQSFSSLNYMNKQYLYDSSQLSFGEQTVEDDEDELFESSESFAGLELPKGPQTGDMMHELFERISFSEINRCQSPADILLNAQIKTMIKEAFEVHLNFLSQNKEEKECLEYYHLIAGYLFQVLKTPLIAPCFCLSQLTDQDKYHEVEFYLPLTEALDGIFGCINGFIDMVFRYDQKYYLLDWKTNTIEAGYSGEKFNIEVNRHYQLQYKIYLLAYVEMLKQRLKNFNYEKHFGGIYYLYVRGMGQGKNGIFYYRPVLDQITEIRDQISRQVRECYEK